MSTQTNKTYPYNSKLYKVEEQDNQNTVRYVCQICSAQAEEPEDVDHWESCTHNEN